MPLSSLYNVNRYQAISAYAGFNGCFEGYLSHRAQWVGINGSPQTSFLSAHTGIGRNHGLGINLAFDQTHLLSKFSGLLSYSYRIKLGSNSNLRLGLSAGLFQVAFDPSKAIVDDNTDVAVVSGRQANMAFNNDFSVYFNFKKLEIGVSVPQILETQAKLELVGSPANFGLRRHLLGYIGYDHHFTENFSLQPSIVYRTFITDFNQLDLNAQLTYKNFISVGVGYRTSNSLLARLNVNIKNKFLVAYVYEMAGSKLTNFSSGSHEVMIGLKFCKNKPPIINDTKVKPVITEEPEVEELEIKEPEIKEPITVESDIKELEIKEPEIKEPITIEPKVKEPETLTPKKEDPFMLRVQFPINSSKIQHEYDEGLEELIQALKDNPKMKIKITGHSCDLGSDPIKQNIAVQRAKSLRNYLAQRGVDATRIEAIGVSDKEPTVPNTNEANRSQNRRVEFSIIK